MDESFEDSATSELPNIHQAMGTVDTERRKIWQATRDAIDKDGLVLGDSLGQGGFGIVFLACDAVTGRKLAIKVLDNPAESEKLRQARQNPTWELCIVGSNFETAFGGGFRKKTRGKGDQG